jgi:hypothetical protein
VITDNSLEVKGAFAALMDCYGLPHVQISPYNSKANGVVERGHFDIREAIVKACDGDLRRWSDHVPFAFFANKITTNRSTGSTPYQLLFGTEPLLPFDLLEATFLTQSITSGMSHSKLLAARLLQLQKRPEDLAAATAALFASRFKSKEHFDAEYEHRMRYCGRDLIGSPLMPGEWVLVANTPAQKSLSRKTKPCYLGPYLIHRETKAGTYLLCKPDGTVNLQAIACDRLLPYFGWDKDALLTCARQAPQLQTLHGPVEEASPFDPAPISTPVPALLWHEPDGVRNDGESDSNGQSHCSDSDDNTPLATRKPSRSVCLPLRFCQDD